MPKVLSPMLFLLASCMSVGGNLRPIWAPNASRIGCRRANGAFQELRISLRGEDGTKLPGAVVTVLSATNSAEAITGNDGDAAIKVPAGRASVRIKIEGFVPFRRSFRIKDGDVCSVAVTLALDTSHPVM